MPWDNLLKSVENSIMFLPAHFQTGRFSGYHGKSKTLNTHTHKQLESKMADLIIHDSMSKEVEAILLLQYFILPSISHHEDSSKNWEVWEYKWAVKAVDVLHLDFFFPGYIPQSLHRRLGQSLCCWGGVLWCGFIKRQGRKIALDEEIHKMFHLPIKLTIEVQKSQSG